MGASALWTTWLILLVVISCSMAIRIRKLTVIKTECRYQNINCINDESASVMRLEGSRLSDTVQVAFAQSPNFCSDLLRPLKSTVLLTDLKNAADGGATLDDGDVISLVEVVFGRTDKAVVPDFGYYFLCVRLMSGVGWDHLGNSTKVAFHRKAAIQQRDEQLERFRDTKPNITVYGLRAECDKCSISDEGVTQVLADHSFDLRLFGVGFDEDTAVKFTTTSADEGATCENFEITKQFQAIEVENSTGHMVKMKVRLAPGGLVSGSTYYVCIRVPHSDGSPTYIHQGSKTYLSILAEKKLLPLWLQVMIIALLLLMSGLFSGLNLGLMALDRTELKIIQNTGTDKEKKFAKVILPVRKLGNYLLCTLLLGNVLVNSTLTILLDDLTSGLVAVIGSTLSIVIFGEIVPQAICSRHGLAVGARTVLITKLFMLLTFPLSFPISKILDVILGEEMGNVYNRERLKELIKVTNEYHDLVKDEVNIISGALELRKKTVSDVMTSLDDVFMLHIDAIMDFNTVSEVMKQGYTRIPVYEHKRSNVVALLNIKDLTFVDPDDNTPLKTLCQFYNHPINYVFEDTNLQAMLDEFKKGQSHMAFVQHVNAETDGDPFYEIVGLVTLEDVIEEIIQSEIIDETDVVLDNKLRTRRKLPKHDFSIFAQQAAPDPAAGFQITPQMTVATFQYLATSVEAFKSDQISENILRRLMKLPIYHTVKLLKDGVLHDTVFMKRFFLYEKGKIADYFALILEGRIRVKIGMEDLGFETGSFMYFGTQAIAQYKAGAFRVDAMDAPLGYRDHMEVRSPTLEPSSNKVSFMPDYTVEPVTDLLYMKVHRSHYIAAYRASRLERQQQGTETNMDDTFKKELDRVMSRLSRGEIVDYRDDSSPVTAVNSEYPADSEKPESTVNKILSFAAPYKSRSSEMQPVSSKKKRLTNSLSLSSMEQPSKNGGVKFAKDTDIDIEDETGFSVVTSKSDRTFLQNTRI